MFTFDVWNCILLGIIFVDVMSWFETCFLFEGFFFFFPGGSHLKPVLCLQGIISKGFAFVKFKNNTDTRIT